MNTSKSLTLGHLFGVRIALDWSWLLILVLVTANLAMGVFPRVHPDWSQALRWGVSLVAAMLFFASILAHELAHAVVAISRGLGVESITLFLFGGVATIEREPDSAKDEFVIAIAGPVMSLLLGGAFLLVAALTGGIARISGGSLGQTLAQLSPISTMMLWLGPINVILAVFNMVPGFPLDGGRVLRSVLWAITRSYRRATQWASTVGQAIGWIFVFAGLGMVLGLQLPFLGSGVLNGLWLGFIGWFLRNAAVQSQQQALVNEMLTNVPVSSLMQQNVRAVPADLRVSQLVSDFVNGGEERCFPVVENGLVAGMVCVDDIRKVKRQEWYGTSVRAIMTGNNAQNTLRPGEDASEALNLLSSRDVPQVQVVEDGKLLGVVRRKDILRWLKSSGRKGQ